MEVKVVYPTKDQHRCEGEHFGNGKEEGFIFTCAICGYKEKFWTKPSRKSQVLTSGDLNALHCGTTRNVQDLYGDEFLKKLQTKVNDDAARFSIIHSGEKPPTPWGLDKK